MNDPLHDREIKPAGPSKIAIHRRTELEFPGSGSKKNRINRRLMGRSFSRDQDLEPVLELYARAFGKVIDERQWSWKYMPPWTERPVAWVAEARDRVVAHLGAVPLRGHVAQEEVTFFLFCDIVVDPEFRSLGIYALLSSGPILTQLARDNPGSVVYGFSGEKVGKWYRMLSAGVTATSVQPSPDRIVRRVESGTGEIELVSWHWGCPEIDRLWVKQRDSSGAGLIRDSLYLGWRYAAHPKYPYSLFGVLHRGEPVGWIVTSAIADTSPRDSETRVHDLLLPAHLRIPALQRLAALLDADAVVAWAAENDVLAGSAARRNGWQVTYLSLSPSVTKEYLAGNVSYTLGEADQWWW